MKSLKFASSAVLAAAALTIGLCATPAAFAADELSLGRPAGERARAVDAASNRPPATFFTIADVLAKLDRQRGRGPNAIRTASLTPPNTATDAVPAAKPLPPVGAEPFGLFTFRAPENGLWRKWRGLESDLAKEQSVLEQCRESATGCPSQAAQFLRLIGAVKSRSGRDRLDEANRAVNQAIRYVSDFAQHGEADRWTAPLATFATGKGDCEDYAIAKYIALSEAGFPREDLRLVLGRDRTIRQDHAVLAAHLDGHWLILDSRRSELIDDGELGNFTPMFAINDRGVQLFAAPYAKRLPLGDELDAAPAAANAVETEWTGAEALDAASPLLGFLPVLM
ncbi:transglutaminase-like cysteine peptidase [Bradyrhizobium elkanii]|uniref:Putative transglutaminase-like cysteine proteinase n=1 Tax=Bradyrhizobium elkanii TaxID=29448 RepID=A0A8I1YEF7_BRAEL|nr:transglutaminase-like cysteine peptidase [Bradyrhizobium elkanii]MBP1298573.1 putative transglutaminase-like cysteine proteinase [Bradyrhizobium elkanii]